MEKRIFKCFISSPSDTNKEREVCSKIINEINNTIGEGLNFVIQSLKWEDDANPGFADYTQNVINKSIGDNYDLFIGIMHKRFGTPTKKAGSGTEEEFDQAYKRFKENDKLEIMFYFNTEGPEDLEQIDTLELDKVNSFKKKIGELGGLYWNYKGVGEFEIKLRQHLSRYFLNESKRQDKKMPENLVEDKIQLEFQSRLKKSLKTYNGQPIIWIEPILSNTNDISQNPDDNFNNRVDVIELTYSPSSKIIKAPPQFGLTCLAHYLVIKAWEHGDFWVYIDSDRAKAHNIHNLVKNEADAFGLSLNDVKCIVLDSWNSFEVSQFKKLKNLIDNYNSIPIYVMQTIDDGKFLIDSNADEIAIDRDFDVLHLLALPRTEIRKVVSEYNKVKLIGEEDVVLAKVTADLETLNIHRTPLNCITLLKVSEKYFDDSPVNRTNMIERILFILFNLDDTHTYKSKPDVKDCEYFLGRFCEGLVRNSVYEFTREQFAEQLISFCKEKLIDLDVDEVFDILLLNGIIIKRELAFSFRSSYWVCYFAAKRMHASDEFLEYIFVSKKYLSLPEIIEFYTGIDRSRSDALKILTKDIHETCAIVQGKVRLPDLMNPLATIQWKPTEEQIDKAQKEIGENVIKSGLPDSLKDKHADKTYNQIRPYNQSIQDIFEQYSLHILMQKVKASSRALRNSDYVEPAVKRELFDGILKSWEQIAKVLFALNPELAANGEAAFEGASFSLIGDFGDTIEKRRKKILLVTPTNVVGFFKNDLSSKKIGPLIYERFESETNPLIKHYLALFLVYTRPRDWKKCIEQYIIEVPKNSYYLYNIVNSLRAKYRYDYLTDKEVNEISYLIKKGLAKHEFGEKNPGIDKIAKIGNQNLPKREGNVDK